VRTFEAKIMNCSEHLPATLSDVQLPPYERYYDSKLPAVTLSLVESCTPLVAELKSKFEDRRRYKHVVVGDEEVSFKRLTSNVSHVVRELDDLRRTPVKFLCLNDDTDPSRVTDNALVQSVLVDFFESVLPAPSVFELPPEYRNKFSHIFELSQWQFYRTLLRCLTAFSFFGLVLMSVSAFFKVDLCKWAESALRTVFPWLCAKTNKEKKEGYSV
jgi:UDP-N-acetylglucosamine-lysosomal-enzyme